MNLRPTFLECSDLKDSAPIWGPNFLLNCHCLPVRCIRLLASGHCESGEHIVKKYFQDTYLDFRAGMNSFKAVVLAYVFFQFPYGFQKYFRDSNEWDE